MQRNEYGFLLSASDLMRFAGCAHATTLDLAWMRGQGPARARTARTRGCCSATATPTKRATWRG